MSAENTSVPNATASTASPTTNATDGEAVTEMPVLTDVPVLNGTLTEPPVLVTFPPVVTEGPTLVATEPPTGAPTESPTEPAYNATFIVENSTGFPTLTSTMAPSLEPNPCQKVKAGDIQLILENSEAPDQMVRVRLLPPKVSCRRYACTHNMVERVLVSCEYSHTFITFCLRPFDRRSLHSTTSPKPLERFTSPIGHGTVQTFWTTAKARWW